MKQFGHLKLRSIVGNNAKSKKNTTVIAQASSLGSLTEDWLEREFFSQSLGAGASCRIIWPTQENVRLSNEGWTAGGSIPCALRNMKPFLRPRLYRWSPPTGLHREHVMPHIKVSVCHTRSDFCVCVCVSHDSHSPIRPSTRLKIESTGFY